MIRGIFFMLAMACWSMPVAGQSADNAIIARTSESISLAPLLYVIDKGYYRKEGVDLEFRILRTELAGAAMVGSWEVGQRSGRLPHLTRSGDRY